jgi:hypothetical protein
MRKIKQTRGERGGLRKGFPHEVTCEQKPGRKRDKPCKYLGGNCVGWKGQPVQRTCSGYMGGISQSSIQHSWREQVRAAQRDSAYYLI